MPNVLRNLPSVNDLLETPQMKGLVDRVSHNVVVTGIRNFLGNLRTDLQTAASDMKIPTPGELADRIANWITSEDKPSLRPVINATGILLHTGLGRAPLADEAIQQVVAISSGYASVELDLKTGERSQRVWAVEKLLRELTGAEAAAIVNNNAAATLIVLTALAKDKEVIVSRGQLIEIGGSFRLPDVMTSSGAQLREIGTTNKVRISDYDNAINDETAALMRVHTSNFMVVGFTQEVTLKELVELGARRQLPVIDDIGSGALIDFTKYGVANEPVASESIKAGADVVLFSGDKLVGGPQCGIIVGRKHLIDKISKHPLMRAMRVDKTTLAALAATLRLYRDQENAEQTVPLLSMLSTPIENLKNRAERLAPQLAATSSIEQAEPVQDQAMLGGGSVPTQVIPTWCVAMTPSRGTIDQLTKKLRASSPSIVGRTQQGRILLDLRTVFPGQDSEIIATIQALDGTHEETADTTAED